MHHRPARILPLLHLLPRILEARLLRLSVSESGVDALADGISRLVEALIDLRAEILRRAVATLLGLLLLRSSVPALLRRRRTEATLLLRGTTETALLLRGSAVRTAWRRTAKSAATAGRRTTERARRIDGGRSAVISRGGRRTIISCTWRKRGSGVRDHRAAERIYALPAEALHGRRAEGSSGRLNWGRRLKWRRRRATERRRLRSGPRRGAAHLRRNADHRSFELARGRDRGARRRGSRIAAAKRTTKRAGRTRRRRRYRGRRPRGRRRTNRRQATGRLIHHQHRPLELRSSGPLDIESALRTSGCGIGVLGSTIRTEHSSHLQRYVLGLKTSRSIQATDRNSQGLSCGRTIP